MKQVLIRGGGVVVEDVPAPSVGPGSVLVRVAYSCVSVGTELSSVQLSGLPLYRRALKQPHHARRALELAREQGFKKTYDRVRGRLAAGLPTGYSAAGTVVAVGEHVEGFAPGDRVACAGAGYANHAEFVDVPVNLVVKVPDRVELDAASTVTLGAIALQGVRRAQPTLGETIGVLGLGILGQLTVQLLRAHGARVIGADPDPSRVAQALENGMEHGVAGDFPAEAVKLTDGFGADAVIVTASTPSDDVVSTAFRACRRKGRVVVVGDVGLRLERHDLYEKELDFLISTSYGPGRYDPVYEEQGRDYPLGYVRWTENRNMEEYVRLLAEGRVRLDNLRGRTYQVTAAPEAYEALQAAGEKPLLVVLSYPEGDGVPARRIGTARVEPLPGLVRVALVGAGNFAEGTHLPNLDRLRDSFQLRAVMSRAGANAKAVAARNGAAYATTDYEEVLADPEVDLVLITTRHDLHAELTLRALAAGKHVFVEKPLALAPAELTAIEDFFAGRDEPPLLVTGFNRRFAPAISRAREALAGRASPLVVDYRMNAGYLPADHWTQGPEGGGRNLGEACHVYDLFDSLTGAEVLDVQAAAIRPQSGHWLRSDNFVATVAYADGSVCTLTYTALGHRGHPKERMEIFADGRVLSLDDYRSLEDTGGRGWSSRTQQKGHLEELQALAGCLLRGGPWPIPLEEQLRAMRVAFAVEERLRA